jgi:hypothetical protein
VKQLQLLLVAVAGAAAAIPGMAELRRFEVPGGAEPLFEFVLAAFSAGVVLTVFAFREKIGKLPDRWLLVVAAAGMAVVLGLFMLHVWLSSKILVMHEWRGEPEPQFVPLFLPDSVDVLIREAGSRFNLLMTHGPDVVLEFTNERNVALTLATLLLSYTALVATLAAVFAMLGFRSLQPAAPSSTVPPASQGPPGPP